VLAPLGRSGRFSEDGQALQDGLAGAGVGHFDEVEAGGPRAGVERVEAVAHDLLVDDLALEVVDGDLVLAEGGADDHEVGHVLAGVGIDLEAELDDLGGVEGHDLVGNGDAVVGSAVVVPVGVAVLEDEVDGVGHLGLVVEGAEHDGEGSVAVGVGEGRLDGLSVAMLHGSGGAVGGIGEVPAIAVDLDSPVHLGVGGGVGYGQGDDVVEGGFGRFPVHALVSASASRAFVLATDVNVVDGAFVDVALGVGGLDVVVHQGVLEAGDFGVVEVGDSGGQDEEVDFGVVAVEGGVEDLLGHAEGSPGADLVASGVGVVVDAGDGVEAVDVGAVLEDHGLDAADVEGVGPDVEVGGVGDLLVSVLGAEADSAGVVGEALGGEDGGRGVVHAGVGVEDLLREVDGDVTGQRGLDLHVDGGAVVHVSAVVGGHEVVPCPFGEG